jgi:hypothetical protein
VCAQKVHGEYVISMPNRALHYYHRRRHSCLRPVAVLPFAKARSCGTIPIYGSGFANPNSLIASCHSLSAFCFARDWQLMLIIRFRCPRERHAHGVINRKLLIIPIQFILWCAAQQLSLSLVLAVNTFKWDELLIGLSFLSLCVTGEINHSIAFN